jgi:hypothetical protein
MKTPAMWLAEQIGERPDDFAPEESPIALAFITAIQADARPRWIPCAETMPGDGEFLICYDVAVGQRVTTSQRLDGKWDGYGEYATHWMPLPEGPKP